MVPIAFSSLAALVLALAQPYITAAVPTDISNSDGLGEQARSFMERSTPAGPHWVTYSDKGISGTYPPAPSDLSGYNVFAIAFLLLEGAWDNAEVWSTLTADERSTVVSQYHAAGISIIVSAFGSTDIPTTSGADPTATANTMASWVLEYGLDGIDIDYEDFDAIEDFANGPTWLATFTTQLRTKLPQGQYILTHAPVAPWFSPNVYSGGAYLAVDQAVGHLIDWYNIQFYNQGSDYTTCAGLLTASSSSYPESALFQIAANGPSLDKLVIGKPGNTGDETNGGYIDPGTLAGCVAQAASQGWNAGVMVWEYPDVGSSWITEVRASAFPVGGSPTSISGAPPPPSTTPPKSKTTTTTTSTSTTSTTTTVGTGNCGSVAAWSSAAIYVGGDQATYDGDLWTAKWWTEDDVPGGAAGVWTNDGPCPEVAAATAHIPFNSAKATVAVEPTAVASNARLASPVAAEPAAAATAKSVLPTPA